MVQGTTITTVRSVSTSRGDFLLTVYLGRVKAFLCPSPTSSEHTPHGRPSLVQPMADSWRVQLWGDGLATLTDHMC